MTYVRIDDAPSGALALALMEASTGQLGLMIQADTTRIVIDDPEVALGLMQGLIDIMPTFVSGKAPDGSVPVLLEDIDKGKGDKRLRKNRRALGLED